MDQIAKGKMDNSFSSMARHTSWATNLDLGCEGMRHIQRQIIDIWALCKADFPDMPRMPEALPSAEI